jgi:type III restriction enzyme
LDAWDAVKNQISARGTYKERKNGLKKDLPTFCIKVPTGGGKTLLATHMLSAAYETILKTRNGKGLVLWIVPSDQIYKDTLKALKDVNHQYRVALEAAVGSRIEVWEKDEISRITPVQLQTRLNILVIILASARRVEKEQLKFFRDSGGNIVNHFPPENEPGKHKELLRRFPNLDMLQQDEKSGEYLVKTSLANLVRICEPPVILDEGHKATSKLARDTLESFNASVIIELSATPPTTANVLVQVGGKELLDEQMIKLPINIANSNQQSWKDCLTQARDKRVELAKVAEKNARQGGLSIRPIVLVQVERTGADKRDAWYVHSEDVREYLQEKLDVPANNIRVKSSSKDEIEGIDLMDEDCPVEWIITKAALQEGWDCPFAYVLVSLNNTGSARSMTQLVGRVLRQPHVQQTPFQSLNESYVYCLKRKAQDILRDVKKALEKEGYEGDAESFVANKADGGVDSAKPVAKIRDRYKTLYKPFDGKIYIPRFAVKLGDDQFEALDYYRHLIRHVDVGKFDFESAGWDLSLEVRNAGDNHYRLTLGSENLESVSDFEAALHESDEQVAAWLITNLSFEQYSYKDLERIVSETLNQVLAKNPDLNGRLAIVRFPLKERLNGFINRETDKQTEAVFRRLFETKKLCFFLECKEARFEIPPQVELRLKKPRLVHDDNSQLQRSLYDYVNSDLNDYERAVALFLDGHPEVLWWYRNLVGPENFAIQGYRRNRIFPDFIVQQGHDDKPSAYVLVVESKGKHLKGNEDTTYKRDVAGYFDKVGRKVRWQRLAREFQDQTFRFQVLDEGDYPDQSWRDELKRALEEL